MPTFSFPFLILMEGDGNLLVVLLFGLNSFGRSLFLYIICLAILSIFMQEFKSLVIKLLEGLNTEIFSLSKLPVFIPLQFLQTKRRNFLFSGIENFFSILKSHLRKIKATNFKTLEKNVKNVLENITKKTYSNIMNGAYRRKKNYVSKKVSKKISKNYKKSAF
jgi:hypothetical protein